MISLKGFIPQLSAQLGTTPNALYERQRALVRGGLLDPLGGRGPGSGVRASAETVAMLLIAELATENLSETERRTREIASATAVGTSRTCELTGASQFVDALVTVLTDTAILRKVRNLRVSRHSPEAEIEFRSSPKRYRSSRFSSTAGQRPSIDVIATIDGKTITAIASKARTLAVRNIVEAPTPSRSARSGRKLKFR